MRKFEKVSYEEYKKETDKSIEEYNEYNLPERKTKYSAGYDFESIIDFELKPNEIKKIPLGIKVIMNEDEMLMILVRGSTGFKYNVRMCNQVGIIESDYYNNIENEGQMFVKLQNEGDKNFIVKKGDRICQGIFVKFLTVDDEKEIETIRTGGFGSTNKGDGKNG